MSASELANLLAGFLETQSSLLAGQAKQLRTLSQDLANGPQDPITRDPVEDEKNKKKEKKSKKVVDPNKPKQTPSAYLLFAKDQMSSLKTQNPTLSQTDVMKLVGSKWKTISQEEKESYSKQAEEKKKQFHEDMSQYNASIGVVPKETKKESVSKKPINTPVVQVSSIPQPSQSLESDLVASPKIGDEISKKKKKKRDSESRDDDESDKKKVRKSCKTILMLFQIFLIFIVFYIVQKKKKKEKRKSTNENE